MNTNVMVKLLKECCVISSLSNGSRRVSFLENFSGHTRTEEMVEAAERINTEVLYFSSNATHLIQLCDSLVIQKLKRF